MPLTKYKQRNSENILERIRRNYDSFSDSYKRIAEYVSSNLEAATFRSLGELSELIGVSDATLIRFAQDLKYSDFKEFREHLAEYIHKIIYSKTPFDYSDPPPVSRLERIKNTDIKYISRTMASINPLRFLNLVDEIVSAKRVFCMGWRISSFLAEFLVFQLRRLDYPAFSIIRDRRTLLEQVLFLSKGDLLIVFDQLIYSEEVLVAVEYAQKNYEIKIVTVTNDPLAHIVQYADLSFFIDLIGQSEFSIISLTAPMVFINAIIEEVFSRNPEKAKNALKIYEDVVLSNPRYATILSPNSLGYSPMESDENNP